MLDSRPVGMSKSMFKKCEQTTGNAHQESGENLHPSLFVNSGLGPEGVWELKCAKINAVNMYFDVFYFQGKSN